MFYLEYLVVYATQAAEFILSIPNKTVIMLRDFVVTQGILPGLDGELL